MWRKYLILDLILFLYYLGSLPKGWLKRAVGLDDLCSQDWAVEMGWCGAGCGLSAGSAVEQPWTAGSRFVLVFLGVLWSRYMFLWRYYVIKH